MHPEDLTIEQVLALPGMEDICEELDNPNYLTRKHGSRATAALGCNGPLCRKAERDRQRERNERRAELAGREYNPRDRLWDRDELLEAVIDWHVQRLQEGRDKERESA